MRLRRHRRGHEIAYLKRSTKLFTDETLIVSGPETARDFVDQVSSSHGLGGYLATFLQCCERRPITAARIEYLQGRFER